MLDRLGKRSNNCRLQAWVQRSFSFSPYQKCAKELASYARNPTFAWSFGHPLSKMKATQLCITYGDVVASSQCFRKKYNSKTNWIQYQRSTAVADTPCLYTTAKSRATLCSGVETRSVQLFHLCSTSSKFDETMLGRVV